MGPATKLMNSSCPPSASPGSALCPRASTGRVQFEGHRALCKEDRRFQHARGSRHVFKRFWAPTKLEVHRALCKGDWLLQNV